MPERTDKLLQELAEGNPKSLGKANAVLAKIGSDQSLFDEVLPGLFAADFMLALRAGNVIEKACRLHPELLQPHKKMLLQKLPGITRTEVKWHVPLLLRHLNLTKSEAAKAASILEKWLAETDHKFVKVNCLQALSDLAIQHPFLRNDVLLLLEETMLKGGAAINARGRKLLKTLAKTS